MTQPPTPEERKRRIKTTFDTLAADYEGLRFVHVCATRLLELANLDANLTEGARVLDVATGTGLVALAAAHIVGPTGRVTGVDFSMQMLDKAREKLAQTDLHNVEFVQGDAESLEFPDAHFDAVLCASSLFFVPDMARAAREFHRVLKPGARVGFSSFGTGFLEPVTSLLTTRLEAYGVPPANPPVSRLADPDICRDLLEDAGFVDVTVISEQLGYHHHNFESRWVEIMVGLEGVPISRLSDEVRERVKDEYRADIEPLFTSDKLWLDVPANFVFGTKPLIT
jgi:ubiquinone/menaquinone biosynthesis C-methylase UbiE